MKPQIHLNQIGYISYMPKTAVVIGGGTHFSVCQKITGKPVFSGRLPAPKMDAASGDMTSTAEFSAVNVPGEYFLKVGSRKSHSFVIAANPYQSVKQALLKAFFFSRCGMTLNRPYAGGFRRKKCHTEPASLFSDPKIKRDVSGGWHDSGDYGRYVCPAATATATLLYAYELFPWSFWEPGGIPESGNGIPDLLNECRYELEWLLKMQDRDGGVYHKAASNVYAENIMPDEDRDEVIVYEKSSAAAADFSAVTALASRIYRAFDKDFSERLRRSATAAWIWLLNNPDQPPFENPPKCLSPAYSDKRLDDDLFWAASEMYRLTGETSFHKTMLDIYERVDTTLFSWNNTGGFGALSYIFAGTRPRDEALLDALKTVFLYRADTAVSLTQHSGYKTAKQASQYLWGSNMDILTSAMLLIVANKISPNADYITAALEQVNYILGKNPMGISYITGQGETACSHPYHRISTADGIDMPIPGMVVGGPDMTRGDEYSKWLIPKGTPPAKCYIDREYSYATNEVSISCNAPAVFVFGFFSALNTDSPALPPEELPNP